MYIYIISVNKNKKNKKGGSTPGILKEYQGEI